MKSTLAFIIFVIAFVSCPVCFLLTVNADAATLECQRVEDRGIHCTRTLWTLRIIPYERTAINDLRGANLTTDDCSDGWLLPGVIVFRYRSHAGSRFG
jgi:hypothetical protein